MGKQSERLSETRFLRILPTAVGIINLLCIGATILGFLPASISGIVFACFVVFSFIFSKGITKIQATYGEKLQILSTYADQILITEKKEMHSPALQQLKAELTSQNQTASQSVHRLAKLMNALDQRGNLLISTILNGLPILGTPPSHANREMERSTLRRSPPLDRSYRSN